MTYAVIGTGAIGGYYGAKLVRGGHDVHFLLHNDYAYVAQHGLTVNSCDGSFVLSHVNAYSDTAAMPKVDVVLVALKSTNNHLLRTLLTPLLHPRLVVVMIQNGIGIEPDVEALFPDIQLVAGLAFICSAKTQSGIIDHQCYGQINFGNFSCRDEVLYQQLLADFNGAGIKAGTVDYLEARWRKAVWNMPFNGMTVALNTTTDRLLRHPSTRQLIHEQMLEVIHAAHSVGAMGIEPEFADKMIAMTDAMVPYSPSMKLDFDFHRPMEIDYLYSRPIAEARAAGFEMSRLSMLEAELRFLQASYL